MSKYEQFALAAACALDVEFNSDSDGGDGKDGTEGIVLSDIVEYVIEREPDSTRASLRRATKGLVEKGALKPADDSATREEGDTISLDTGIGVPEATWDALCQFTSEWTIGLGGRLLSGEFRFLNAPHVEIGYGGDDLDGELGVPITPTSITGLRWRRRLVLKTLRVREVQHPSSEGEAIWSNAADVQRQFRSEGIMGDRAVKNALDAFVDSGLVQRRESDNTSGSTAYRTTKAGRAALGLFVRCWWAVIPEERCPPQGAFAARGGERGATPEEWSGGGL